MVFIELSRALLLVSLLPLCTQSVDDELVDIETLAKITDFFHNNYEKTGQYAVAINVPKQQCITFDESTFLTRDRDVRFTSDDPKELMPAPIYVGTELIGAVPFQGRHSEDRLMNPPNDSHLTDLLIINGLDRCVVFYTLISPCLGSCLGNNAESILPGLDKLKAHTGIKAFAFTHIYAEDQHKDLISELGKVAERVPLYRCFYKCILCGKPGSSTPIKKECTLESTHFQNFINNLYGYTPNNAG